MRVFLLLCFLCFKISMAQCQQIFLESGKTTSSFDYKDSNVETLDNLQSSSHTFLMIGFRKNLWTKHAYYNFFASYNGYGAIGSDRALDNYFEWDLNYLGFGFGLDYELYRPGNFSFYLKASASVEILMQGSQTLNNQVYNLYGEEDFDGALFAVRPGIGVQYKISENLSVFSQYTYGVSNTFKNISGNLKIRTNNIGLGLLFNISKDKATGTCVSTTQLEKLKKKIETNSSKIKVLDESYNIIEQLQKDNAANIKRISIKDQELKNIKESILKAMIPYRGNDLSIEVEDNHVKIILDSDMLFKSGNWTITKEGEKAVDALGEVLASNPEIKIRIEGHTDNLPYKSKGEIKNNWDLSTKRATSIVDILRKNQNIKLANISAVGKGEYNPIGDNNTKKGRAKNRRIEIILAPELTELMNIIKN